MKNQKIEHHIYRAIEQAPVDLCSKIKSQPVDKLENHDFITRQDTQQDSKRYWKPLMAFGSMAAVFLIIFVGWWTQYNPVDSVIYLDVNPSIQILVDKNEQVVDLKTLKAGDAALITNIDYKGKNLYWVAEQLLDVLIAEGYIDESHHTLLVSVLNNDIEIGSRQSTRLNSSIRDHLQKQSIQGVVLRQAITKSNTIEDFARDYEISVGKMTFIRNLIILDPNLKVEDLVILSLEELVRISAKTGLDIKRIIEVDQELDELYQDVDDDDELDDYDYDYDDDSDVGISPTVAANQLIGHEKAIEIALGLTGGGVVDDIELDEDDGFYSYEIEIVKDGIEYDIEIDALTGKVLEFEIND
jgi:uncharacterized membrane protein YkoI